MDVYHSIYSALHENDKKTSMFDDLVIRRASYSSSVVSRDACGRGTFCVPFQ